MDCTATKSTLHPSAHTSHPIPTTKRRTTKNILFEQHSYLLHISESQKLVIHFNHNCYRYLSLLTVKNTPWRKFSYFYLSPCFLPWLWVLKERNVSIPSGKGWKVTVFPKSATGSKGTNLTYQISLIKIPYFLMDLVLICHPHLGVVWPMLILCKVCVPNTIFLLFSSLWNASNRISNELCQVNNRQYLFDRS